MKYCTRCGAQSDDSAIFCGSCGERFPDQQPLGTHVQPQPRLFVAEQGTGAHKHIATDVYLKDAQGNVSLVARRQSMLHLNYTIVDSTESPMGYIQHKSHLSHVTFSVEDSIHTPLGSVNISSIRSRGALPGCWIDDPSGNKQATLTFTNYIFAFNATKLDGSTIFDASFSGQGQGLRQQLSQVEHKVHGVRLYDPDFPLPVLLAVFVAVDVSP